MPEQVYPGSRDIADRLLRLIDAGRVGQPFLFVGPSGSGKEVTALEVARRCQCRRPAGVCRHGDLCESCRKAVTFQHPDIRWLGPAPAGLEDPGKSDQIRRIFEAKIEDPFFQPDFAASSQILIGNPDQPGPLTVRGLQQFLRRRSFQSRWQVVIMVDAERMNSSAANALLKTLEEPPPSALIMLLCSSPAGLPQTVLSRCQQIMVTPYPESEVVRLLGVLRPQTDDQQRQEAARCAAGDLRRALDLLSPESLALRGWTEELFADLCRGRPGRLHRAAEMLHGGQLGGKQEKTDPAARRRLALRVCDHLAWLLAETLACRELGDAWRPRFNGSADLVRRAAATRDTTVLLQDIARVERARRQIVGNLNLGLVMAVLLQDLSDHASAA